MWVKMKGRKLQSRRATAQHARGPRNIAEHREGGGKHLHGDRASGRERRAIGRAVFVAARSKLALCLVNRRKESSARLDRVLSVGEGVIALPSLLTELQTREVCLWSHQLTLAQIQVQAVTLVGVNELLERVAVVALVGLLESSSTPRGLVLRTFVAHCKLLR